MIRDPRSDEQQLIKFGRIGPGRAEDQLVSGFAQRQQRAGVGAGAGAGEGGVTEGRRRKAFGHGCLA